MRALVKTFERSIDRLGLLGSLAIIFVALLSVAEIFRRYVLVDPSIWANELIIAIAAATYVLAGPYALLKRRHIEITVFSDLFPRWLKSISETTKVLCGLIYLGALTYGAYDMAVSAISGGETLGGAWDVPIPQFTKGILFVACSLFLLLLLVKLIRTIRAIITGSEFEAPLESDTQ